MWAKVLQLILGFLGGPGLASLVEGYKAKLAAGNTTEKIAADLAARQLALDQREAELNSDTVRAEEGNWITRWVRPALALPVVILLSKLLVWDKALGQWTGGHTPALDINQWKIIFIIVTAYMGGRSLEKIAGKFAK